MAERLLCNPSPPSFLELEQQEAAVSSLEEQEAALSSSEEEEAALSSSEEEEAALSTSEEQEAALSSSEQQEAAIEELDIACEDDINKEPADNLGVHENDYYCKTCNCTMSSEICWYSHLNGKRHKKKLAAIYITPYIKIQAQPNTNMQDNKIAGVSEEGDSSCSISTLPPSALPRMLQQTRNLSEEKYFQLISELATDLSAKYDPEPSYEDKLKKCHETFKKHYFACAYQRLQSDLAVRERMIHHIQEKNYIAAFKAFHLDVVPKDGLEKPVIDQLIKEGIIMPHKKT